MKKLFKTFFSSILLLGTGFFSYSQSMTILPNSAGLPSLSFNQIKTIPQPQAGMVVYDKDFKCLRFYNGTDWINPTLSNFGVTEGYAWSVATEINFAGAPNVTIAVDSAKNVIIAGMFANRMVFGTDTLSTAITPERNHFIAKYTSDGTLLWYRHLKYAIAAAGANTKIAIGINNDIFITCNTVGSVSLNNVVIANSTFACQFVAKFDKDGGLEFAKTITSTVQAVSGAITTDLNGNLYISGRLNTNVTIDAQTITGGTADHYVCKLTPAGVLVWVKLLNNTTITNLVCDATGSIYAVGLFGFNATLSSLGVPFQLTANGNDMLIVKLATSNGDPIYVKKEGGAGNEAFASVGIDATGNIYLLGQYDAATTLINGSTITGTSSGGVVIVSYTAAGAFRFVNNITGTNNTLRMQIDVDSGGIIYAVVRNESGLPLSISTPGALTGTSAQGIVYIKFSGNGNMLSAKTIATPSVATTISTFAIKSDGFGGAFLAGTYLVAPILFGQTLLPMSLWKVGNTTNTGQNLFIGRAN